MTAFALDIALVALLLLTIGFSFSFHRKLQDLRKNKDNFGAIIEKFSATIVQAEIGIQKLRSLSEEIKTQLEERLDKGQALRDDLSFLVERGSLAADQIANLLHQARPLTHPNPTPQLQLVGQEKGAKKKVKRQKKDHNVESLTERKLKKAVKK